MNVWTHLKTGNLYTVIDAHAEMKDPQSGNWEHAIIYKKINPVSEPDSHRFCRERTDFNKSFARAEQPKLGE